MPAPITGKPCFLYHTTAWQQRDNKNKNWEKVADETLHLPFFVDDSTGRLLIEPLGADLDLQRDFREEYDASLFSSNLEQLSPRISSFLSRHGVTPSRHLRIEERLIEPDDFLFIAGTLAENPGVQLRPLATPNASLTPSPDCTAERTSSPQVIKLESGPVPISTQEMSQQAKIAAALTRAGITRPEAWSVAGVPYQSVVVEENNRVATATTLNGRQNADTESDFNPAPPTVLMKGPTDPLFVISYRSQKEFASALAWKSAAMIWGGAAITLLGVYMFLLQMRLL